MWTLHPRPALRLLGRSLFVGRGRLFSYRIASMRGAAISGGVWTLHPAAGLSVLRLCPPAARKGGGLVIRPTKGRTLHTGQKNSAGALFSSPHFGAVVHVVHIVHIWGVSYNLLNVWRLSVLSIFVHIGCGAVHKPRAGCVLRLWPPAARKGKHGKRTARGRSSLLHTSGRFPRCLYLSIFGGGVVHIVHVVHIRGAAV